MPLITDHLASAREHLEHAGDAPRHHYVEFTGHVLCVLEDLIEAVDLLQMQVNAQRVNDRKEKSA